MENINRKPVVNPVLSFSRDYTPKTVQGGGKNEKGIVSSRLSKQRKSLSETFSGYAKSNLKTRAGKSHFLVKMFSDSVASTWTPTDLFSSKDGAKIIAPGHEGYLVEMASDCIDKMAEEIQNTTSSKKRVDISRVEKVKAFEGLDSLRGRDFSDIWKNSNQNEKHQFVFWLLPFDDLDARESVVNELSSFYESGALELGNPKYDVFQSSERSKRDVFDEILNAYRETGKVSFSAKISDSDDLMKIVASGMAYRVEPVSSLGTNSAPPGHGPEPVPPVDKDGVLPAIVVVDGGLSAQSYKNLEVLSITPLINNADADLVHGNQVASIICNGHAWNNGLYLPKLDCRIIPAQAIAKSGVIDQPTPTQFLEYLKGVADLTKDYAKVWNLSFNERSELGVNSSVSYLGHELNKLARKYDILPIISIGNRYPLVTSTCPPADCESAITVGGRLNEHGLPGATCGIGVKGPGPAGMKKPELSWFSELRVIGGGVEKGTSYTAPLVASLAAHTFQVLKDPTPDLVKALLINNAELDNHSDSLGWGTPWVPNSVPWACQEDSVTITWKAKLKAGFSYYWNDISIPVEMFDGEKLSGEIILTAILKPKVSEMAGRNYFATRLEVALQAESPRGKVINILSGAKKGSNNKDKELQKWNPVRNHRRAVKRKSIKRETVRLYARVFARDLYQFGISSHHELDEQDVVFVLSFRKEGMGDKLYNSLMIELGSDVQSAVRDIDIDIDLSH